MVSILRTLVLGVAFLGSDGFANAQSPMAPQTQNNNRPVVLQGREDLANFGELTFVVYDNNVDMVDASRQTIKGKAATLGGNRFAFTFKDCVYEGEMVNGVLAGRARYTSGAAVGQTWNFAVRFAGNL